MQISALARRLNVNAIGVMGALAIVCALATGAARLAASGPLWAKQVGVCWVVYQAGRKALLWALAQIEKAKESGWD